MSKLNLSLLLKTSEKLTAITNRSHEIIVDKNTDLVTRFMEVDTYATATRAAIMTGLVKLVDNHIEVEDWKFSTSFGVLLTECKGLPEVKAFNKLDDKAKRRFQQAWSEVIAIPKMTGVTPAEKKKGQRKAAKAKKGAAPKAAKSKPLTLAQVESAIITFSAKEQMELLKKLNKALGLGLTATQLKVG